jgi:hypothetical protein
MDLRSALLGGEPGAEEVSPLEGIGVSGFAWGAFDFACDRARTAKVCLLTLPCQGRRLENTLSFTMIG